MLVVVFQCGNSDRTTPGSFTNVVTGGSVGRTATTAFTVASATQIEAFTSAGIPGVADIIVTTASNNSGTTGQKLLTDADAGPGKTTIGPQIGLTAGDTITITGSNASPAPIVTARPQPPGRSGATRQPMCRSAGQADRPGAGQHYDRHTSVRTQTADADPGIAGRRSRAAHPPGASRISTSRATRSRNSAPRPATERTRHSSFRCRSAASLKAFDALAKE